MNYIDHDVYLRANSRLSSKADVICRAYPDEWVLVTKEEYYWSGSLRSVTSNGNLEHHKFDTEVEATAFLNENFAAWLDSRESILTLLNV